VIPTPAKKVDLGPLQQPKRWQLVVLSKQLALPLHSSSNANQMVKLPFRHRLKKYRYLMISREFITRQKVGRQQLQLLLLLLQQHQQQQQLGGKDHWKSPLMFFVMTYPMTQGYLHSTGLVLATHRRLPNSPNMLMDPPPVTITLKPHPKASCGDHCCQGNV
jgi:hypothetical protein